MTVTVPTWAAAAARDLPYPLIFATVSGAHLYGFASADSDLDIRVAHLLPAAEVVGLRTGPETLQHEALRDGVELDVVSHDLLKFARLLTSRNGYVLEQLLSPLVLVTGDTHAALTHLAPALITTGHAHHYLGFATSQERLFDSTHKLKPALYLLRVLLTGIHLMRTGTLETDLAVLAAGHSDVAGPGADLSYVAELIAHKRTAEQATFPTEYETTLRADATRLRATLEQARDTSALPAHPDPSAVDALNDLVIHTRLT